MGYYGGYGGAPFYGQPYYGYGAPYQPCCYPKKGGSNTGFFFALIVLLFILFVIIGGVGYC